MNDAEELIFGRKLVTDACLAKAEGLWAEDRPREEVSDWSRASIIRAAVGTLNEPRTHIEGDIYAYATCFCQDGDLLSQWRAYASEGGYAIGFRSDALISSLQGTKIELVKLLYGAEQAQPELDRMIAGLAPAATGKIGTEGWHTAVFELLPLAAVLKHPSFSEEQEWRLLDINLKLADKLNFNASPRGLIPYRTHQLPRECIAEIVVGPGPRADTRYRTVQVLAQYMEIPNVSVRMSSSTLRY